MYLDLQVKLAQYSQYGTSGTSLEVHLECTGKERVDDCIDCRDPGNHTWTLTWRIHRRPFWSWAGAWGSSPKVHSGLSDFYRTCADAGQAHHSFVLVWLSGRAFSFETGATWYLPSNEAFATRTLISMLLRVCSKVSSTGCTSFTAEFVRSGMWRCRCPLRRKESRQCGQLYGLVPGIGLVRGFVGGGTSMMLESGL